MLLGCIADDFTGATDLANNLVRAGMRVVQYIGIPSSGPEPDVDAVVIALKSRTIEPADAVQQSLAGLKWLQAHGAKQIYFKVCSTFDSTDQGNIGPVTQALAEVMGADIVPVCPAFPENQRTVFNGHLFVGDMLLSDSGMRNHPLTPMTDSNLVKVLQRQVQSKVGLVDYRHVSAGEASIKKRLQELCSQGNRFAIVDAITDRDLLTIGQSFSDCSLLVAGSGVAIGLPQNHGLRTNTEAAQIPLPSGHAAILSGSCSTMSNAQVLNFCEAGGQAFALDARHLAMGVDLIEEAKRWCAERLGSTPVLIYATAPPEVVEEVQSRLGVVKAGDMVEAALASLARWLVAHGVQQLIVAGGETSGACVKALGIERMRIGPQIDPGVPWCYAHARSCDQDLHIALKSGNFGTVDFFSKAFEQLNQ